MAPVSAQHRRTHNLLLISKLLNPRDAATPFTLVLDSLEQTGKPLIAEYFKRAHHAGLGIVFVSFETLRRPKYATAFVEAWRQDLQAWSKEVSAHVTKDQGQKKLLIFDSLNYISAAPSLPALLSSFINPTTTLVAVYHTDLTGAVRSGPNDPYSPSPLSLLKFLATTVMTTHSLHQVLAKKAARERSQVEPSFGLDEEVSGVIQGFNSNGNDGVVLEVEHRRKSGRGIREWYVLMPESASASSKTVASAVAPRDGVMLLEDHPLYRTASEVAGGRTEAEPVGASFELGLTEKQRQDREGVVLPYFDAQKGVAEGGRILYDMGEDDDFDEEEDEI